MWVESKARIGGVLAIEHKKTKEVCISSKYGEIWNHSPNTYKAVVRSSSIYRKVCSVLGIPYQRLGIDEGLVKFSEDKLPLVMKALGVKKNRKSMIRYSNSF